MKIKNEKGVTLVALVITILVLIIIASISIGVGTQNQENAQDEKLIMEVKMVQNAILQRKKKSELTKENLPGTALSQEEVQTLQNKLTSKGITLKSNTGYKRLNETNLKELGITNTNDVYIVNYNTGEVINESQIDETTKALYSYAIE